MPLLAVARLSKRLSVYFYNYGKSCASRTYVLLALSLSFITLFSYPVIKKTFQTDHLQPKIPLADLDGQIWQSSIHVQFHNFTLFRRQPTTYLITQQIRISQPSNEVDFDLIKKASSIYESMATTMIDLDPSNSPVSLSTICYKYYGRCLVYRPHYRDENDWLTTIHDKPNERHPFTNFANVSLDSQGRFLRADAVLLTFVLKQRQQHAHSNTLRIWNALWDKTQSKFNMLDVNSHPYSTLKITGNGDQHLINNNKSPIYAQAQIIPHMIEYKFKLIPFDLSYQAQLSIVAYVVVFFLVSTAFGKSNLVRSGPIFGLAAIFLSTACFTTTWGIFDILGVKLDSAPWFLLLFTVNVASLENVFLLTHAILYAGCDMIVVEKISRGLQSVGVPMTTTLIAELLILNIGKAMDSDVIKEFCLFSEVALIVDYILGMTFVISVLSIDIKRVELTDLDDRKMSKRLHELAKCDVDTTQKSDFCPVQDTLNEIDAMPCGDCKDFKTHRAFNSLMLCLIVLGLSLFCSRSKENMVDALSSNFIDLDQPDMVPVENTHSVELNILANRFWSIVNPDKRTLCVQIQPPHLVVYPPKLIEATTSTAIEEASPSLHLTSPSITAHTLGEEKDPIQSHLDQIQHHYDIKSKLAKSKYNNDKQPASLFRTLMLNMLQNTIIFILGINVPSLLLCLVMIAIIIWMTPTWREQWLMPFIKRTFEQSIHALIRILPFNIVKTFFFKGAIQNHPVVTKSLEYEPDGIQHRGAIAVQNMFNQQQYRTNVKQVRIKTLSHQHTADVYQLDANTKNSIVSYGHDGKIILWDPERAKWMARLDKMIPVGGLLQAHLNPEYFNHAIPIKRSNHNKNTNTNNAPLVSTAGGGIKKQMSFFKQHTSKPSCIKVDQGNRWVAAGYDNGMIRLWNINTGMLVRELDVRPPPVQVQHETNELQTRDKEGRNRVIKQGSSSSSLSSSFLEGGRGTGGAEGYSFINHINHADGALLNLNRTLHLQFIGTVTEYCHPIVAEAAARCKSNDGNTTQSCLLSVHKGGIIREWDIVSSECIQTIQTGHTRDITQFHVVDSRAPHRKLGITWVFTASKDGLVKCFERYQQPQQPQQQQQQQSYQSQQNYQHQQQHQQQKQKWELLYTIDLTSHGAVTSIATEIPVGGMGILVTGSKDGTVKVWNFETGEALATLSVGRYQRASSTSSEYSSADSIRSFSKFPSSASLLNEATTSSKKLDLYNDINIGSSSEPFTAAAADHHSSIQQVVVTRYCEVENGPGICRACDTCFGNGFLIASSSTDNKVHAWRLERSDSNHEASCTLCTKDYHRKQYKHRKLITPIAEDTNSTSSSSSSSSSSIIQTTTPTRRRSSSSNSSTPTSPKKIVRHIRSLPKNKNAILEDNNMELLDIEQIAGDSNIPLGSSFLGIVEQPAGYGLVFCDKILSGVRRTPNNEWEVWFASLQYYDPTANNNSLLIPIETFNLDDSKPETPSPEYHDEEEHNKQSTGQLKEALQGLFSNKDVTDSFKYKRIHCNTPSDDNEDLEIDDEAGEILPFSSVRRVIPLDGSGLACDFGNFIKLVYLDRPSLTQKEQMKLNEHGLTPTTTAKTTKTTSANSPLQTRLDTITLLNNKPDDCGSTSGNNGCCGGLNSGSGVCCKS